eukprot:scaffold2695_cov142-Isochrysis_galbana.AAC.3
MWMLLKAAEDLFKTVEESDDNANVTAIMRVEASFGGLAHWVDVPKGGSVADLRLACAGAVGRPSRELTLLCAGRKLSDDAAALADVLFSRRLMLLSHGPRPQPRLTLHDAYRVITAYAVEVPAGARVSDLIALSRIALGVPISVVDVGLYSAHLNMLLTPEHLIADYDLPDLSEAYIVRGSPPGRVVAPLVSSQLRTTGRCGPSRLTTVAKEPSAVAEPASRAQLHRANVFSGSFPRRLL